MKRTRVWSALLTLVCVCLTWPSASAARLQRWLYYSANLWVDANITTLSGVLRRAAAAGYTHVLLSDSKFARLEDMDARYFNNVATIKSLAESLGLEIVPALFPIGYSNDILFHDPNLIEALPATNVLLVVSNGLAGLQPDLAVVFPGGDFSDLSRWSWKDSIVAADDGTARVTDPKGQNARIVQTLQVTPFRQYHISVRVKTQDFLGTPEVKVLAAGSALNYNPLGAQRTQDWQTHHVVFNSLTNRQISVYFGCWDGTAGSLWWDEARIEEVAFLNLVRRPGAPLVVRRENSTNLVEGIDYPHFLDTSMGVKPWSGCYDVYHSPPPLPVNLPDGTRLRASWHHAVTVYDGQAMICPSEPATLALLQDQAGRVHATWGAKGYMMSHDEIRVMNWCCACQQRQLDAGAMLATNVATCIKILRAVNPGGRIYVWSDMFDPYHNAHDNYYLVRGNLAGSWLGLDEQIVILPWNLGTRTNSLQFFSERGHRQVLAGYYDGPVSRATQWLSVAKPFPGILGIMYTTWQNSYANLEAFSGMVSDFEIRNAWQLSARWLGEGLELEFPTVSGSTYSVRRATDGMHFQEWTNFTSSAAIARCWDPATNQSTRFYQAVTAP